MPRLTSILLAGAVLLLSANARADKVCYCGNNVRRGPTYYTVWWQNSCQPDAVRCAKKCFADRYYTSEWGGDDPPAPRRDLHCSNESGPKPEDSPPEQVYSTREYKDVDGCAYDRDIFGYAKFYLHKEEGESDTCRAKTNEKAGAAERAAP
jgi:hypothetical protein